MKTFISYADVLKPLLEAIIVSPQSHAKWLNTLSYLENCGARKIAACEHPTLVKEEMLKHAAEEFRHALHLKRQIDKLGASPLEDYSLHNILGGIQTLRYLSKLDLHTSRYLAQTQGLNKPAVKEAAYLLVTYAIELRAQELYGLYDQTLRAFSSKVSVKSILLEENEHLREMHDSLLAIPNGFLFAERICAYESSLCQSWLRYF